MTFSNLSLYNLFIDSRIFTESEAGTINLSNRGDLEISIIG